MGLLVDVLGLSYANVVHAVYNCTRHSKVDAFQAMLDVWSQQRLHVPCANSHVGVMQLLLSMALLTTHQTGP
jgi:hypothetical protein